MGWAPSPTLTTDTIPQGRGKPLPYGLGRHPFAQRGRQGACRRALAPLRKGSCQAYA